MASLSADSRTVLRRLARRPGFTTLAVLTLGVGIGVSAAMFTVVRWVVLRPVAALQRAHGVVISGIAMLPADARSVSKAKTVFSHAALFKTTYMFPADRSVARPLLVSAVSPEFFPLLAVVPSLGRTFLPTEYEPGHGGEAILSYSFWRRNFSGDRSVLGRRLNLAGRDYAVVGVLPEWFRFRDPAFSPAAQTVGVWVPLALTSAELHERGEERFDLDGEASEHSSALRVIANIHPGLTLAEANRRLHAFALDKAAEYPADKYLVQGLRFVSPRSWLVEWNDRTLWLLLSAFCLVLLISSANFISLTLAAGVSRKREMAIREALGASQARLLRLTLRENLAVGVAGAAVAVVVAFGGVRLFRALAPPGRIARLQGVGIDAWTVGFTLLVMALVAVVSSILVVPRLPGPMSIVLRYHPSDRLRAAPDGTSRQLQVLATAQVALATVLLVSAALVARSLWSMARTSPGFDFRGVLLTGVGPAAGGWAHIEPARIREFFGVTLTELESTPGISSVGLTTAVFPWPSVLEFSVGQPARAGRFAGSLAWWQRVTNGYFATLRIPLLEGRLFTEGPTVPPSEVLINRRLALEYFPEADPIGQTLEVDPSYSFGSRAEPMPMRVVGVVGDVQMRGLASQVRPEIYTPLLSLPAVSAYILVRSPLGPEAVLAKVRNIVGGAGHGMAVSNFKPFEDQMDEYLAPERFLAALSAVFALTALALALIGLYGNLAYLVRLRTPEVAVRRALGAQSRQILTLVLGRALLWVLGGVGIGLLAAAALMRLVRSWFFGVSSTDPWTFAGVALALLMTGLLSAYFPAKRALGVNAATALREE
jgi:predicted permease